MKFGVCRFKYARVHSSLVLPDTIVWKPVAEAVRNASQSRWRARGRRFWGAADCRVWSMGTDRGDAVQLGKRESERAEGARAASRAGHDGPAAA